MTDSRYSNNNPNNNSSMLFGAISYSKTMGQFAVIWKEQIMANMSQNEMLSQDFAKFSNLDKSIWEASCHIMMELQGSENHHLFPKDHLNPYAQLAKNKAWHELKITVENERFFNVRAYGYAFWNMLISESNGGVIPDEQYDAFVDNMLANLQKFWRGDEDKITADVFVEAVANFRTLAHAYHMIYADQPKVDYDRSNRNS